MVTTNAKPTTPVVPKKTKPAARLTKNDKQVMKRAHLVRSTTGKRKKENQDEPTVIRSIKQ